MLIYAGNYSFLRNTKWSLTFLWLFLSYVSGFSQTYTATNYSIVDGLPNQSITSLYEDSKGYLWVGTPTGLARFDGRIFTSFTTSDGLVHDHISCVNEGAKGQILVGTTRGISIFYQNAFTSYLVPTIEGDTAPSYVTSIFARNDSIYYTNILGELGYIYKEQQGILTSPKKIIQISSSRDDEFTVFENGLLFKQQSGRSKFIKVPGVISQDFRFVAGESSYYLYNQHSVYKIDTVATQVPWSTADDLILFDLDLGKFLVKQGKVLQLKDKLLSGSNDAESILELQTDISKTLKDTERNIWLGTKGNGLLKLQKNQFVKYDLEEAIFPMMKNGGTLWVGTLGDGLSIKSNDGWKHVQFPSRELNYIRDLQKVSDRQLMLATHGGLIAYDYSSGKYNIINQSNAKIPYDVINCIERTPEGGLWVGTNGQGLFKLDDNHVSTYYTYETGLLSGFIYDLKLIGNALFIGTARGLHKIENGTLEKVNIQILSGYPITSLFEMKNGSVLIGSIGRGFAVYSPATDSLLHVSKADGLISDNLYFVFEHEDGTIWAGSDRGINRVEISDGKVKRVNLFNQKNGFKPVETNTNSYLINDQEILIGSANGIYKYVPKNSNEFHSHPLHFQQIELFYEDVSARFLSVAENGGTPTFSHIENHLTFVVNQVNKLNPEMTRYRYILENFDNTWSESSLINQVTYSKLPPGNFVFRVQSTDNNGNWQQGTLDFKFQINPPFYQQPVFIALVFLFVLLIILFSLRLHVQRKIERAFLIDKIRRGEQEKIRKDLSRDFHDEMGNHLARIINYMTMLRMKDSKNELYQRVEESAKYLNSGTKDFIWAIDPENDELNHLFVYIKDFGERLFNFTDINFRSFNNLASEHPLPTGYAREIIWIAKEILTNAFKHANATNVSLTIDENGHRNFFLRVEDDGNGFIDDPQPKRGLSNIRIRARRIGGEVFISSLPGKTVVQLSFSLSD